MRRLLILFLIVVATLLFISCDNGDYESGPIIEEPTFGTLVYIDDDGNIHPWSEDGDFTGMTPIIIED